MTDTGFLCPNCRLPLMRDGGRAVCESGHSFDYAKQGYLNLILSQKGGTHGDNRDMVEARRAFLATGHYAFLSDAVQAAVREALFPNAVLFDAGCGEGYYTENMVKELDFPLSLYAVDISKEALKLAARRLPHAHFAAASLYDIPMPDESVDCVTLLFSPFGRSEFLRILRPKGKLIMAVPGRMHLFGLKKILYDTPYENEVKDPEIEGFRLLREETLEKHVTLSESEMDTLFRMTPYYYRTGAEGKARFYRESSLRTPLAFTLFVYEKTARGN